MKSIQERILEKVERVPFSGCWVWMASTDKNGYARIQINDRASEAHRVSYEAFVGPILNGLHIDHLCRVPCCVNPSHLEPVTPAENNRRGLSISAEHAKKTQCPMGHEYTPANTYVWKNRRHCKACNALRTRKYKEKMLRARGQS